MFFESRHTCSHAPINGNPLQRPFVPVPHVLIHTKEHGEGHEEVDGVEQGAHGVHAAFVHKGVVGELQGRRVAEMDEPVNRLHGNRAR